MGAVVTPAQALLTLVPSHARLEVEARIANSDIDEVRVGQRVAIKVDAHDFTRFGLLEGRVRSISRDAVPQAEADPATEPVYLARVALAREMPAGDVRRVTSLVVGMGVAAAVKAGRRSIADYLLSPGKEHAHDSLREI